MVLCVSMLVCLYQVQVCIFDRVRDNQPYVGKNVSRFSAAITKVLPDGPSLQIWSPLLVARPR